MNQDPTSHSSRYRHRLALVSVGTLTLVTALLLGAGSSSGQAGSSAAPPGPRVGAALKTMQKAPVVSLHTPTAAKRTPMTFRLVVTIENSSGGGTSVGTKVMDAVFNEQGLLLQANTRDAHLASIYKTADTNNDGGDGFTALECRERCRHHLDDGNAPKYGVCWWACFIEFGTSKQPVDGRLPGVPPVRK